VLPRDGRRILTALLVMKFFQNAALAVVPPLLVRVSDSFGLSPTQAGGVIGAFGISRLVVILPLGLYLSQISRASGMVLGGVGFSFAGTVLYGAAQGYPWLLLGRAFMGIGNGMTYLAGLQLIFSLGPRSHVARLVNIWEAVGVGSLVVHTVAGGIIGDRWGWRAAFVWAATSVLISGIVFLLGCPALKTPKLWEGSFDAGVDGTAQVSGSTSRGTLYTLILMTAFTLGVCWTGVLTTLIPLYGGKILGLRPSQIGGALSAAYLLDVLLLFPAGRVMDRHARTILLVPSLGILMVGGLLLPHTSSFWSYLAVAAFFATGLAIWNVPTILVADLRLGPRQGFLLSIVRFVGDVANALAPVALGFLIERAGYRVAAWAFALLLSGNLFIAASDLVRRRLWLAFPAPRV